MKLSLILLLLVSATAFAQQEDIEVTLEESPQRESEPEVTHQDYSISSGSLIINYTKVDEADGANENSGTYTSYSILLPYNKNGSQVDLNQSDFTFRYAYSSGLISFDSQKTELLELNVNQIDNVVYVKGFVQYTSIDHLNRKESRKLSINLEFKAHSTVLKKHYSYRLDNSIIDMPPDPEPETEQIEEPVIFADVEPEFPGGQVGMMKYINENIVYPPSCLEAGIQGRVYLSFVIEKDGSVSSVKLLRGIHQDIDREAIRVIKQMPKWKPGEMDNGQKVRVKYSVPVSFILK